MNGWSINRRSGVLLVASIAACVAACAGDSSSSTTADAADAVADIPPALDVPTDVLPDILPPQPTGFPAESRVLILDYDMRPPVAWSRFMETMEAKGHSVVYRRGYPHPTGVDVALDADTGLYPYRLIVVAAGGGAPHATERMSAADEALLHSYLTAGGHLLWAPSNGWSDSVLGESAWVVGNRLLERLGIGVRVERNTVIGGAPIGVGNKSPLHKGSDTSYPGALEWNLDFPVMQVASGYEPMSDVQGYLAAGYSPSISCEEDDAAVLVRVPWFSLLWWHHGTADDGVSYALGTEPMAAMARVPDGEGFITIAPASFLTLADGSGRLADQPVLDADLLTHTIAVGQRIASEALRLALAPETFTPNGCNGGKVPLFSATAPGLEPVGEGPIASGHLPLSEREVLAMPPVVLDGAPPLEESYTPPSPADGVPWPAWLSGGKARIGYAELLSKVNSEETLSQWTDLGMNAFVMVTNTALLSAYDGTGYMEEQSAALSAAAVTAGVPVFLGVHYADPFGDPATAFGTVRDPDGAPVNAPIPLEGAWWSGPVRDMVLGGARVQAAHPGITGLNLDLELYGGSSLWYRDGHLTDDVTWGVIVDALSALEPERSAEAASQTVSTRYGWLVTQGLLPFAEQVLEDAVAAQAITLLAEARAISPAFQIMLYMPVASDSWFYRGLMRGWSSAQEPLVVLSYDVSTARVGAALRQQGLAVRLVGGLIGTLFDAADLQAGLLHTAQRSDGYWLFQLKDFPNTDDPAVIATKHSTPQAYFDAVQAVNAALDAASP